MKRALTAAVILGFCLSFPALAGAQELGAKGQGVLSADRLMGLSWSHVAVEVGPLTDKRDYSSFGFGWRGAGQRSPFDAPRLAFDYMIIEHLSLGGALGYVSHELDDDRDVSEFIVSPRIGYAYAFGRVVGIWPRGGFTYHSTSVDGGVDEKGFAFTAECPLTFSPSTHFAIHVGPTFDVDLFGDREPSPVTETDVTYRTFGINAGLLGWF
jgi:hypothetical protein